MPHTSRVAIVAASLDILGGQGVQATWPTWFWPGMIPIDHCFVGAGVVVTGRRVGADIGSDHLPVHLSIALP